MKAIQQKIRGYIATEKNKIVLLYRRTGKITFLISINYDSRKESIEVGSRFYGKIYPDRCDLSPDGTYFLYFAMGKSQKHYVKKLYCWTGICTPPNIKANILFAHGDTWGGGGRFIDDKTIYISPGMQPEFDTARLYTFDKYQVTFTGNYENGGWLSGKGWKLAETQIDPRYGKKYPIPKYWTKTNGETTLVLHYSDRKYEIIDNKSKDTFSLDHVNKACTWADYDNLGRLIVARESGLLIYQNLKEVVKNSPLKTFDLENIISKTQ